VRLRRPPTQKNTASFPPVAITPTRRSAPHRGPRGSPPDRPLHHYHHRRAGSGEGRVGGGASERDPCAHGGVRRRVRLGGGERSRWAAAKPLARFPAVAVRLSACRPVSPAAPHGTELHAESPALASARAHHHRPVDTSCENTRPTTHISLDRIGSKAGRQEGRMVIIAESRN
jgi:hypothetical protein